MRSTAPLGILFCHDQALAAPIKANAFDGSHEGKTTEALVVAHMAGIPARIVTPAELQRGFPPELRTLLLVGLNRIDDSWHWYDGLESGLRRFVERGGKVVLDHESILPPAIQGIRTGLKFRNYVKQSIMDSTPLIFERNRDNIAILQRTLRWDEAPCVDAGSPWIWALPSRAGQVHYVTVVNRTPQRGEPRRYSRIDPVIDFHWRSNQVVPGVVTNGFQVRWDGVLTPSVSGNYRFKLVADDEGTLAIDGKIFLSIGKKNQASLLARPAQTPDTVRVRLQRGHAYHLQIRIANTAHDAQARLYWQPPNGSLQILPGSAIRAGNGADAKPGFAAVYGDSPGWRNLSKFVQPVEPRLRWHLPAGHHLYELRSQRELSPAEGTVCDLRKHPFAVYAITPAPVSAPSYTLSLAPSGFIQISPTIPALDGIPVAVDIRTGKETVRVYSATGLTTRLPVHVSTLNEGVRIELRVRELLRNTSQGYRPLALTEKRQRKTLAAECREAFDDGAAIPAFGRRRVPLMIGLTPRQRSSRRLLSAVQQLSAQLKRLGRSVEIRSITPGDLIRSPRRYAAILKYPFWSSPEADLILLGTPRENFLLFDLARGGLLLPVPKAGYRLQYLWSPFHGEFDAVVIQAPDDDGVVRGIHALMDRLRPSADQ